MKKRTSIGYCFNLICIMILALSFKTPHNSEKIIDGIMVDTVSFTASRSGGWSIRSCYLNQDTRDSVQFELILKQTDFSDWRKEQFIGRINSRAFIPKTNQRVRFFFIA